MYFNFVPNVYLKFVPNVYLKFCTGCVAKICTRCVVGIGSIKPYWIRNFGSIPVPSLKFGIGSVISHRIHILCSNRFHSNYFVPDPHLKLKPVVLSRFAKIITCINVQVDW